MCHNDWKSNLVAVEAINLLSSLRNEEFYQSFAIDIYTKMQIGWSGVKPDGLYTTAKETQIFEAYRREMNQALVCLFQTLGHSKSFAGICYEFLARNSK